MNWRGCLLAYAIGIAAWASPPVGAAEREVVVEVEGASLAGALTLPDSPGPHPAVLIVPASGPHPRDEARTGGTHWADLAGALAERGVASLRLDSRSASTTPREDGASDNPDDYRWTPSEIAADSHAALLLLRKAREIDSGSIGLIGFSDGASRAAMIASQYPEYVSFCVLLSASGVPVSEDIVAQQVNQARSSGLDAAAVAGVESQGRKALSLIISGQSEEETLAEIAALLTMLGMPADATAGTAEAILANFSNRGARALLGHDPRPHLERMTCPTLCINGGADSRLVSPRSRPAILEAFEVETSDQLCAVTIGGLGHFLEPVGDEQSRTFDASVISQILHWLALQGVGHSPR